MRGLLSGIVGAALLVGTPAVAQSIPGAAFQSVSRSTEPIMFGRVGPAPATRSLDAVADVPGLVFPVVAGAIYRVRASVAFRTAATTTGLRLGFNGPTGMTSSITISVPLSAAAVATELKLPGTGQNAVLIGTGVSSTVLDHVGEVEGFIFVNGSSGNFSITYASEVAGSLVTIQTTSACIVERVF